MAAHHTFMLHAPSQAPGPPFHATRCCVPALVTPLSTIPPPFPPTRTQYCDQGGHGSTPRAVHQHTAGEWGT